MSRGDECGACVNCLFDKYIKENANTLTLKELEEINVRHVTVELVFDWIHRSNLAKFNNPDPTGKSCLNGLPDAIDGLNQIGMPEGAKMISALRDFIYTFLPLYEATLKEKQDLRDKVIAEEHRTKQAAAAASSSR